MRFGRYASWERRWLRETGPGGVEFEEIGRGFSCKLRERARYRLTGERVGRAESSKKKGRGQMECKDAAPISLRRGRWSD